MKKFLLLALATISLVSCQFISGNDTTALQSNIKNAFTNKSQENVITNLGNPSSARVDTVANLVVNALRYDDAFMLAQLYHYDEAVTEGEPFIEFFFKDDACYSVASNMVRYTIPREIYTANVVSVKILCITILIIFAILSACLISSRIKEHRDYNIWNWKKGELDEKLKEYDRKAQVLEGDYLILRNELSKLQPRKPNWDFDNLDEDDIEFFKKDISELIKDERVLSLIRNEKVNTIGELCTRPMSFYTKIEGFGRQAVKVLTESLDDYELKTGLDLSKYGYPPVAK